MSELLARASSPLPPSVALGVHEVVHLPTAGSTMDEAHARAARGAPAGTIIVADEQTAGRGRGGNSWQSEAGGGVWLTLIERPTDATAVDVLSIRLGLAIADAVQPFADSPVQLKWPNDLYIGQRKLAGILVEARWREGVIDWVAIGVGINLAGPEGNSQAIALRAGTSRNDVMLRVVPALRLAAVASGPLSAIEQRNWTIRDLSVGRHISAPTSGIVMGLEQNGALRVRDNANVIHELRTGSLIFTDSVQRSTTNG